MKPVIGLTIGDPAGVGPEIVLRAVLSPAVRALCRPVVFGDRALLERVYGKRLPAFELMDLKNVPLARFKFGEATAANGKASGAYIEAAVRAAQKKTIDAVVTAPINKQAFLMGGWGKKYTGHTEMVTALTGAKKTALMLVYGAMRAIHVTSHIPLKKVASALTVNRVYETILLADLGLKQLGFRKPMISVCGLNPHAGDNGLMGSEEKKIILPAVLRARKQGLEVSGPLPADTVWPNVWDGLYDVGVAMYHDQGQIPVKLLAFQRKDGQAVVRGVNVTIGLPIIRTSVAHGTAYEIAGKGIASEQSLIDAIRLAVTMSRSKT